MTRTLDIERKRGDTRRIPFQVLDSEGSVEDITGWTDFTFTVTYISAPVSNTSKVFQVAGVVDVASEGTFYVVPPGTSEAGNYYYDVQAIDSNSEKTTPYEGTYVLTQDRTKT